MWFGGQRVENEKHRFVSSTQRTWRINHNVPRDLRDALTRRIWIEASKRTWRAVAAAAAAAAASPAPLSFVFPACGRNTL